MRNISYGSQEPPSPSNLEPAKMAAGGSGAEYYEGILAKFL